MGLATNPANSLSLASCGKDASVRLWDLTGALPDLMAVAAGKEATGAVPERDEVGVDYASGAGAAKRCGQVKPIYQ